MEELFNHHNYRQDIQCKNPNNSEENCNLGKFKKFLIAANQIEYFPENEMRSTVSRSWWCKKGERKRESIRNHKIVIYVLYIHILVIYIHITKFTFTFICCHIGNIRIYIYIYITFHIQHYTLYIANIHILPIRTFHLS